jgi:hypothetical protein
MVRDTEIQDYIFYYHILFTSVLAWNQSWQFGTLYFTAILVNNTLCTIQPVICLFKLFSVSFVKLTICIHLLLRIQPKF